MGCGFTYLIDDDYLQSWESRWEEMLSVVIKKIMLGSIRKAFGCCRKKSGACWHSYGRAFAADFWNLWSAAPRARIAHPLDQPDLDSYVARGSGQDCCKDSQWMLLVVRMTH